MDIKTVRQRLLNLIHFKQGWREIDPFSLQFRLTVGATVVSILGIGGVGMWTTWKTQQILVGSYEQSIQAVSDRFPQDVELYGDMLPTPEALRRAVDIRTFPNLMIVVTDNAGQVITQSRDVWQHEELSAAITALSAVPKPEIYQTNNRYIILCKTPLVIDGNHLGNLHVAQDITTAYTMFWAVIRNLAIGSVLAMVAIAIIIALYVKRSLQPLRQMSQLTSTISAEDLDKAQSQLQHAPTEVRELVQTCKQMLTKLSESLEQQRRFVSDVSHELRTPLTVVYGYIQSTLRRSTNLTDPQQEALRIAASETDRTIRLLQDLLDLARADTGHMHFNLEPFSLTEVVAELRGMAAGFNDRDIQIETPREKVLVKADRNRLKQVLLNLLDNALKYSEPDQPVVLKLDQLGGQAVIQVCDRGYGIPLQHQARIFDRFYRVDEARARTTGGCGLGLSIVKTLIEGMGGSVSLRSKLNEGSIFVVTLPLSTV
ncbi:MAG: HAMP domain-containing histidine kinase [Leptolyngbyaceae cyanobacterium RM2_2_4]|nr:HAMP domain-containing histidine kinase [Leptolyngbyaceae cyanobacterium SM1_4_3]NJN92109.1 HAMP domain-containing histidine kinase [Leptolyngbyaceae cyanobacterium SL_5_14]NJO50848.1 HAMP domain-containing histidine kinase [Leptolyngbyaceae cyanobacterium RM2_2_4]